MKANQTTVLQWSNSLIVFLTVSVLFIKLFQALHLQLCLTSRVHRTMILRCFCYEILIPEFLWPEVIEIYSQSFSFQGANLGQIPVAFISCVKSINCGIQEIGWFMFCAEGKRLLCCSMAAAGAARNAYQRQLRGHLCFSLCARMYEQCTLLLSPKMKVIVKKRGKSLLQTWWKYIIYVCIFIR